VCVCVCVCMCTIFQPFVDVINIELEMEFMGFKLINFHVALYPVHLSWRAAATCLLVLPCFQSYNHSNGSFQWFISSLQ